jgi:hypothetical protein
MITEVVEVHATQDTGLAGNNSAFETTNLVVQIVMSRGGQMMRPKILIAVGLVLAFFAGTLVSGIYTATTRAFNPSSESSVVPAQSFRSAPVTRTRYVARAPVTTSNNVRTVSQTQNKRSLKKSALIVGGSAGAGAAIGAVAGGGKGAAIGAMSGGVAGLIYDLATRNN